MSVSGDDEHFILHDLDGDPYTLGLAWACSSQRSALPCTFSTFSRCKTALTAYTSAPPIAVVCDCSQHPPPPAADLNSSEWLDSGDRDAPSCADGDGGRVD